MIKLTLVVGFIFSHCIGTSLQDIIVPFLNNLYAVDTSHDTVVSLQVFNGFASQYSYDNGATVFFMGKANDSRENEIFLYDKALKTTSRFLSGNYQFFVLANNRLLTIANSLSDSGFEIALHTIANSKPGIIDSQRIGFIDLLINDYALHGDELFISGNSPFNNSKKCCRVNTTTKKIDTILQEKNADNFYKLAINGSFLFIYSSEKACKSTNHALTYIKLSDLKSGAAPGMVRTRELDVRGDKAACVFYGKGIIVQHWLLLPLLNRDFSTSAILVDLYGGFKIQKTISLPTGIYKHILTDTGKKTIHYLGYNFYKDKTKFYYVAANYASGTIKIIEQLPFGQ